MTTERLSNTNINQPGNGWQTITGSGGDNNPGFTPSWAFFNGDGFYAFNSSGAGAGNQAIYQNFTGQAGQQYSVDVDFFAQFANNVPAGTGHSYRVEIIDTSNGTRIASRDGFVGNGQTQSVNFSFQATGSGSYQIRIINTNVTSFVENTDLNVTSASVIGPAPATPNGVVDGTSGNDVMTAGYTDAQGDQVDGTDGNNDSIFGNGGNDSISAGAGNDTIYGGLDSDTVLGEAGNDVIYGDAGADFLNGSDGADTLYGGDGDDSIRGEGLGSTAGGALGDADLLFGGLGNDTLLGDEGNDTVYGGVGDDSIGGGKAEDLLYGEEGNDTLNGGEGSDTIYGGDGDDSLLGGAGNDSLYGGVGSDTLDGGDGNDLIDTGDGFNQQAYGGAGADTITGGAQDDVLYAGAGDDQVSGGAGDDVLHGDSGNNTLNAGTGNDFIYAGTGNDTAFGGDGNDFITAQLNGGANELHGDAGADTVNGGAGSDTIYGGVGNDQLEGLGGNDVIYGGAGNDLIAGGDGADTIYGGSGDQIWGLADADTIIINAAELDAAGLTTSAITVNGGDSGVDNDTLDLTSYGAYRNLTQTTDVDGNSTSGSVEVQDAGGNWVLVNFTEIENLLLPAPSLNYIVEGTAGGDLIDAGYTGDPQGDMVDALDNQTGTNDDVIEAGAGNDTVLAGLGDDEVYGGLGDDSIFGGAGNDTVFGGEGSDTVDGGDGDDLINTRTSPGNGRPDSALIIPDNPLTPIDESQFGYTADNDPNTDRDSVLGGAGNDTILTGDDDDTIFGGVGNDVIDAGFDDDNVFGGDGSDTIVGSEGNDTIEGGADNDLIFGGLNPETIYEFGNDTATGAQISAIYDITDNVDPNTDNNRDLLFGGSGNDTIFGQDDADTLHGDQGDDLLYGGIDNDSLYGGEDNDTLLGEHGDDALFGGIGNDSLHGGDGADTIFGGDGDDFIRGEGLGTTPGGALGAGDLLDGGAGNDTIFGDEGNDTVYGGIGNDSIGGGKDDDLLFGGDGNDTVNGGIGNDTLDGGTGTNTLTGGDGNDTFVWDGASTTTVTDWQSGITGAVNDGDQTNNDFVDLSNWYNTTTLTTVNGAGGNFGNALGMLWADAEDGIIDGIIGGVDYSELLGLTGSLTLQGANDNNLTTDTTNVVCFTRGTRILAQGGEIAIEKLEIGDLILTMDHGFKPIRWIGSVKVEGRGRLAPIFIRAGTMKNLRDLRVSPQHRMFISGHDAELLFGEGEVLAAAKHLVNDDTIRVQECAEVEYFHILFDEHEIIFAEGCPSESFHPGQKGWGALAEETRAEIITLFPQFANEAFSTFGPSARLSLKSHQAELVMNSRNSM